MIEASTNKEEIITRKSRHYAPSTTDDDKSKKDVTVETDDNYDDKEYEDETERYMNEEPGSGVKINDDTNIGGDDSFEKAYNRYRNNLYRNRFRLDYANTRNNKKLQRENQKDLVFDDDDDDDDDEEDEDDESNDEKSGKNRMQNSQEGSGGNFNDDSNNDDDDDDAFFALKRKSNKYFRKNTNDAIKIISTPHGKVGIVYQQTPVETTKDSSTNDKTKTDFSSITSISSSSSSNGAAGRDRLGYSPKITPVLTADGKVALLYRGESENTKYEPILNLTHTFNNNDNKTSNSVTIVNSSTKVDNNNNMGGSSGGEALGSDYDDSTPDNEKLNNVNGGGDDDEQSSSSTILDQDAQNPSSDNEYENSILPNINRPLSEVLGIKKNQFTQFRIKDAQTTTSASSMSSSSSSGTTDLPEYFKNHHQLQTTINLRQPSRSGTFDDYELENSFNDRIRQYNQLDSGILRSESGQNNPTISSVPSISAEASAQDILSKTEVVNLAIIPHFDEEFERQQHYHHAIDHNHHETSTTTTNRRHNHYKQRHRYRHLNEDLSGVHCAMQAMMGIAAISTVFGMLGAFFKQRILDQIRMMHW